MGNYELLKAAINEVIKANGRQEITGEVLNQVLLSMVNSLGAGYQCMGVATPSTNPGTPDQNVFYFATQAGTYTNFYAIVLQAGISVLIWDGDWASQTWFTVDATPTNNSQNLIASGAVFNALKLDGGAYDVTAHNSGATFASLSELLNSANLATLIPAEIRHGGMSIKFVQSSDNNYVKFFCTADEFTTDVTQWQGVDDEPTAESDNLVKSGGVNNTILDNSKGELITSQSISSIYTNMEKYIVQSKGYILCINVTEDIASASIGFSTSESVAGIYKYLVEDIPLYAGNHYYYIENISGKYLRIYDNNSRQYIQGNIYLYELSEDSISKIQKELGYHSGTFTMVTGTTFRAVLPFVIKANEPLYIKVESSDASVSGTFQIKLDNTAVSEVALNSSVIMTPSANGSYIEIVKASSGISTGGTVKVIIANTNGLSYLNISNSNRISVLETEIGFNRKLSKTVTAGTEFLQTFYNSFKVGDVVNIVFVGRELFNEDVLIRDNSSTTLSRITKDGVYTITLAQATSYIELKRGGSNVIKSGTAQISIFSGATQRIPQIFAAFSNNITEISKEVKEISDNTGFNYSNSVAAVAGTSYFNTLSKAFKANQTVLVSLEGESGIINGKGNLASDSGVLAEIAVGERKEITLSADTTYLKFSRGSSNVIGSGIVTLRVTAGMNTSIIEINDSIKVIDERVDALEPSEDSIILKASILEGQWAGREEYLRSKYEDSGEPEHWYGVEWQEQNNAQNVTAINSSGDGSLHTQLPIQSKMKRCIRKDGIVQYYLDANNSELKEDGTAAKLDGTDGNVFVEIPEFFYKFEDEIINGNRVLRIKLSEQGLNGFLFSPKRYTSAYEATVNRTTNKFASVCTTLFTRDTEEISIVSSSNYVVGTGYSLGTQKTALRNGFTSNATNYRGGVNNATLDNETNPSSENFARNQLGIPVSNINRNHCRALADSNNKEFMHQYDTQKILWILSLVEFKNRNIQATSLGLGATVYPDYNAYEAFFKPQRGIACIPCGVTNVLGNKSGQVFFKMQNVPIASSGSGESITYTAWGDVWVPCMSYRGIEHYYGHIYKVADQVSVVGVFTGNYLPGHDGEDGYGLNDIYYYYQKNPYLTSEKIKNENLLGKYTFASKVRPIKSILGTSAGHILPIETVDNNVYSENYCDCCEILVKGIDKVMYPTFNGRIVSGSLVGTNFIVATDVVGSGTTRPSDGTRIDAF